jgi:protease I
MLLKGKKIAMLAEETYHVLELWVPKFRLEEEGAKVDIVGGGGAQKYASSQGYSVNVDVQAEAVSASQYDGVVIPGGYAPDRMRRQPAMVKLVKDAFDQGKVVAAICHAAWMPVNAGILKGKKATSWISLRVDVENAGGTWVDQEVVVDGNLISSRKPEDLPAFCRELVKALAKNNR